MKGVACIIPGKALSTAAAGTSQVRESKGHPYPGNLPDLTESPTRVPEAGRGCGPGGKVWVRVSVSGMSSGLIGYWHEWGFRSHHENALVLIRSIFAVCVWREKERESTLHTHTMHCESSNSRVTTLCLTISEGLVLFCPRLVIFPEYLNLYSPHALRVLPWITMVGWT